jgi:acetyltransferase-like isoleucine patch superfamily enzyme
MTISSTDTGRWAHPSGQTPETAVPRPYVPRRRLTWRNGTAMLRWLWMKAWHRNVTGGLFYMGRDCWFEIGKDAVFDVGAHTRFLGRFTCSVHGRVKIGTETHFSRDTQLSSMQSIAIGNNCAFAEGTAIHDMTHCFGPEWAHMSFWDRPFWTAPIVIGDNVWVGCKVTIVGGVTIGDDVVIAANSVVTRNVPSHSLAAGSPARVVRTWAEEVSEKP